MTWDSSGILGSMKSLRELLLVVWMDAEGEKLTCGDREGTAIPSKRCRRSPQWRGSLWTCDCYKGAKVSLRMNTGCLKEKQPPCWHLRARLLLAQASKGADKHMSKKLTSRARAVSLKMSGSLKVLCAFPVLPI